MSHTSVDVMLDPHWTNHNHWSNDSGKQRITCWKLGFNRRHAAVDPSEWIHVLRFLAPSTHSSRTQPSGRVSVLSFLGGPARCRSCTINLHGRRPTYRWNARRALTNRRQGRTAPAAYFESATDELRCSALYDQQRRQYTERLTWLLG